MLSFVRSPRTGLPSLSYLIAGGRAHLPSLSCVSGSRGLSISRWSTSSLGVPSRPDCLTISSKFQLWSAPPSLHARDYGPLTLSPTRSLSFSSWISRSLTRRRQGWQWRATRAVLAVPSHEVRRFRGQSRPRLIWSAHQPAILSSNAEKNRSWHVSTLLIASSTLAKILKGLQADVHSM